MVDFPLFEIRSKIVVQSTKYVVPPYFGHHSGTPSLRSNEARRTERSGSLGQLSSMLRLLAWPLATALAPPRCAVVYHDFSGHDIPFACATPSAKDCCDTCKANWLCHAFSFDVPAGYCYLKTQGGPAAAPEPRLSGWVNASCSCEGTPASMPRCWNSTGGTCRLPSPPPPPARIPAARAAFPLADVQLLAQAGEDGQKSERCAAFSSSIRRLRH
jgi:hypothetical protein